MRGDINLDQAAGQALKDAQTELRGFEDPVKLWELRWQDD